MTNEEWLDKWLDNVKGHDSIFYHLLFTEKSEEKEPYSGLILRNPSPG